MIKRQSGSFTVEAMVLTPLLIFLFICLIDGLFIAHNRVVARADLSMIKSSLQQHLAESPDDWTVNVLSDWQSGNVDESVQVNRGLSDSFHLFLSDADLLKRARQAIWQFDHSALYEVTDLKIETRSLFFNAHYRMRYECRIHSPFQFLTKHLYNDYQTLRGVLTIPCRSHRQQLHDIALVIDYIERIKEIESLVKTIRGVLINCLNIL